VSRLQDKKVSKEQEISVKCPSAMVDGRMDFLKDELRNEFKEDEQEMGVGTFSLFSNPGSGSTGGGGGGTGTGNNKRKGGTAAAAASKAKTVTETATAAAARNAKIAAARLRKDTVRSFSQMGAASSKALIAGDNMVQSIRKMYNGNDEVRLVLIVIVIPMFRCELNWVWAQAQCYYSGVG
jgi:hypothetical protein